MVSAGVDVPDSCDRELRRNPSACGRAVTKLPVEVVAPGPHPSIDCERKCVVAAAGDFGDAGDIPNRHRAHPPSRGAVPQLPVGVVPPRQHGSVRTDGVAHVSSGGHVRDIVETRDLRGRRDVLGRAETELAKPSVAPGPHRAVRPDRQAVVVAGLDLYNIGQSEAHRNISVDGGAVSDLPVSVQSPGPDVSL